MSATSQEMANRDPGWPTIGGGYGHYLMNRTFPVVFLEIGLMKSSSIKTVLINFRQIFT